MLYNYEHRNLSITKRDIEKLSRLLFINKRKPNKKDYYLAFIELVNQYLPNYEDEIIPSYDLLYIILNHYLTILHTHKTVIKTVPPPNIEKPTKSTTIIKKTKVNNVFIPLEPIIEVYFIFHYLYVIYCNNRNLN